MEGGKRSAEWVGLRFKAQGLKRWAQPKAQRPIVVSRIIASPDSPLAPPVNASPTNALLTSSSGSDESDAASEPPVSLRRVVAEPHVPNSPISEARVDLAKPTRESGAIAETETLAFSDSQYEQGQPSNWMVESKEAEGWASLSGVHTDNIDGELASPLQCSPIAMVVPSGVLTVFEQTAPEPSQWVKSRHRSFCKLVGFPIESHKQECLALLQRIEAERFARKATLVPRCKQTPGIKGKCELLSLISTVNYEGRQSAC